MPGQYGFTKHFKQLIVIVKTFESVVLDCL